MSGSGTYAVLTTVERIEAWLYFSSSFSVKPLIEL
jgi:hypothetical protein